MFQRPFETILLASVLAVVACRELYADSLALWASQIQTLYWSDGTGLDLPDPTTYLATVAEIIILLSICVVHLIYEKPNWQMAGVYISSIFSILFGLAWIVAPGSYFLLSDYPTIRIMIRFVAALLVLVSVAIRFLLPLPRLPTLPKHLVGTQQFYFDYSELEKSESAAAALRKELDAFGVTTGPHGKQMRVRVWYPTDRKTSQRAPYMDGSVLQAMIKVFLDMDGYMLRMVNLVTSHILLSRSNSWLEAPVSQQRPKWPLIVMSHGLKASPEIYSAYAEFLASKGNIVVAPAHTDGSCPENWREQEKWMWTFTNAQLRQRAQDVSFVTTHLASREGFHNRIDWNNVGICGHSFGGASTIAVFKHDRRFTAAVAWDTWMWALSPSDYLTPSSKSIMFINSEWFLHGAGRADNLALVEHVCRGNGSGGHMCLLRDTAHHNYSDLGLFLHPTLVDRISRGDTGPLRLFGGLKPNRALQVTMDETALFFEQAFGSSSTNKSSSGGLVSAEPLPESMFANHPEVVYRFVPHGPCEELPLNMNEVLKYEQCAKGEVLAEKDN